MNRRNFLKLFGAAPVALVPAAAVASEDKPPEEEHPLYVVDVPSRTTNTEREAVARQQAGALGYTHVEQAGHVWERYEKPVGGNMFCAWCVPTESISYDPTAHGSWQAGWPGYISEQVPLSEAIDILRREEARVTWPAETGWVRIGARDVPGKVW